MTVGIEIGSDALRAISTRSSERPTAVTPYSGRVEDLAEALRRLLTELGGRAKRAALAVPSHWCHYRTVRFPYRSPVRIERTLRYALEGRLPGPIDGYIVEPVGDIENVGATGARVAVAACERDALAGVLDACRSAGVGPCVIQPALVSAVRHTVRVGRDVARAGALLVRVSGARCDLAWTKDGNLIAAQTFHLGSIDARDPNSAEALGGRVRLAVRAHLASDGAAGAERAFVTAPARVAEAFAEAIGTAVGVPAEPVTDDRVEADFFAPLGAAEDAETRKHLAVNLRQGALAYRPYAQRTDRRIAAALFLACALAGAWTLSEARDIVRIGRQMTATRQRQAELYREVAGDGPPAIRPMRAAILRLRADAEGSPLAQTTSALRRWVALMALVPKGSRIAFETIDIQQRGLQIVAHAPAASDIWGFRENVRRSALFQPDPRTSTENRPAGGVSLRMELRYRR